MFLIGCTALLDIFVYWRTTSALLLLLLLSLHRHCYSLAVLFYVMCVCHIFQ